MRHRHNQDRVSAHFMARTLPTAAVAEFLWAGAGSGIEVLIGPLRPVSEVAARWICVNGIWGQFSPLGPCHTPPRSPGTSTRAGNVAGAPGALGAPRHLGRGSSRHLALGEPPGSSQRGASPSYRDRSTAPGGAPRPPGPADGRGHPPSVPPTRASHWRRRPPLPQSPAVARGPPSPGAGRRFNPPAPPPPVTPGTCRPASPPGRA